MKHFVVALFLLNGAVLGTSGETPTEAASAGQAIEGRTAENAAPAPAVEKSNATPPGASEPTPPPTGNVNTVQERATPPVPLPADGPVSKETPVVAPLSAPATVPGPLPPSEANVEKAEPVVVPLAGCVAPLQGLVDYHEKELANVKEVIARWNSKVGLTLKDRDALEQNRAAKQKKLAELQGTPSKSGKKEAALLKKEISKINKSVQAVEKELLAHRKNLTSEIQSLMRASQQGVKETGQRVLVEIQKSAN